MGLRAVHLPAIYERFLIKRIQVLYNWQADHPRVKALINHLSKLYQTQNRIVKAIVIALVQRIDPTRTSLVALTMA